MDVVERTYRAFTREGEADRVPVHAWLGLPFIRSLVPRQTTMRDLFERWIDDPAGTLIQYQLDLGLDPMITTYSRHIGEVEIWPRMLFPYPPEALEDWQEDIVEVERTSVARTLRHDIRTPAGDGHYVHRIEGYSSWLLEHLIKKPADIDLLLYRPDPTFLELDRFKRMIASAGNRAWWLHHAPGPWDEAVELRGITALSTDLYDRPEFVHRLMRMVTDRLIKLYWRLGETGIHAISLNETWVGIGVSPQVYRDFIQPYDAECVAAAHEAGYLVSYHNCGTGSTILEDMVQTHPDALETITASGSAGDFDLADVKRRVGRQVCIFGGFNERLLTTDNPDLVRAEVRRCLEAAAGGGGYILRPAGQIFHADPRNVAVMAQAVHDFGRY